MYRRVLGSKCRREVVVMRAVSGHNYFRKFRKGFSLIELVCVIVLLGILASAAAPKYMALQRDARIARLEALKGALKSADSMIMAKAAVQGDNLNAESYTDTNNYFEYNGVKYYKKYGHIDRNNMAYFIDGTPPGAVDKGIAKSRTEKVAGHQFRCRSFVGVCEYEWCDCYEAKTKVPGFPNDNGKVVGNSGQTSGDAAKAAQYFIPHGMEPSKFETDLCLVVYQQPVKLKDGSIYPSKVAVISDGC